MTYAEILDVTADVRWILRWREVTTASECPLFEEHQVDVSFRKLTLKMTNFGPTNDPMTYLAK